MIKKEFENNILNIEKQLYKIRIFLRDYILEFQDDNPSKEERSSIIDIYSNLEILYNTIEDYNNKFIKF